MTMGLAPVSATRYACSILDPSQTAVSGQAVCTVTFALAPVSAIRYACSVSEPPYYSFGACCLHIDIFARTCVCDDVRLVGSRTRRCASPPRHRCSESSLRFVLPVLGRLASRCVLHGACLYLACVRTCVCCGLVYGRCARMGFSHGK